jgi:hypothetical protein
MHVGGGFTFASSKGCGFVSPEKVEAVLDEPSWMERLERYLFLVAQPLSLWLLIGV